MMEFVINKGLVILALIIFSGLIYLYFSLNSKPNKFLNGFVSGNYILSESSKNPPPRDFRADNKEATLKEIVANYANSTQTTLAIGIKNVTTGQQLFLNPKLVMPSASLYKLIVMYGIFSENRGGNLNINDPQIGSALERMISISSNEDALALADLIGWGKLTQMAQNLGLINTSLNDPPATTAEDITNFLYLLAEKRALDPKNSQAMTDLLLKQKINNRIPALLPANTKVAHKTGELDDVRHDAGIIFAPHSIYVLTVMTQNFKTEAEVVNLIANLSRDIYNYFESQN